MRERRNERGKEKKNVKKRGKGENEVYLLLRRIICVVSLCCLTDGMRDVYTGHTQKNGAVNTQITTTPHHSFVYALYIVCINLNSHVLY